ncbi:hypothetical protein ACSBR1_005709 [Camellia fascicularis]
MSGRCLLVVVWCFMVVGCIEGRKLQEKNGEKMKKPEWILDGNPSWVSGGGGWKVSTLGHSFSIGGDGGVTVGDSGNGGINVGSLNNMEMKKP